MGKENVIIDSAVTTTASNEYLTLTTEETATLGNLYSLDGEMMNYWFGEAGEAFVDMSNIIEREVNNLTTFSDNVHNELAQSVVNFDDLDTDRSESVEIDSVGKTGGKE